LAQGEIAPGVPMFDSIILLAGAVEQSPLAMVLRGHNERLAIHAVATEGDLVALDPNVLPRARLIAFSTPVIVPPNVLKALGYGGYNFHPGPPRYPGWSPAHFALYEQAAEFGATAHVMIERVDAGPIIDVALFAIPPGITVEALEGLAYAHLARLFWELACRLATDAAPLPERPLQWGPRKTSRRSYEAICDIPLDITKEELDRRLRAFGGNHFGVTPAIHLHGVKFQAVI
jgi:methionyl-tRNA formyltransferase